MQIIIEIKIYNFMNTKIFENLKNARLLASHKHVFKIFVKIIFKKKNDYKSTFFLKSVG